MNEFVLTEWQHSTLKLALSTDNIAILEPNPKGTLEQHNVSLSLQTQMNELIAQGLFEESSSELIEAIEAFRTQYGYSYRSFRITDRGKQMFNIKSAWVN